MIATSDVAAEVAQPAAVRYAWKDWPEYSLANGAGLPISLQIAGRPFEDHRVLKAGDAFEKATNFRKIRPTLSAAGLTPSSSA